jgi:hypothetical protein
MLCPMSKRRDHLRKGGHRHNVTSSGVRHDPRLLRALGRIDANGFTWETVAQDILPLFERARPMSIAAAPPVLTALPPGVSVGFGVDAGPAFMRISTAHLAKWAIDLRTLTDQALANLRARTRALDARDVRLGQIDGIAVDLFESGDGWASTTVLLPDAMSRLFGAGPSLFIAPWRDLLVRLPPEVDLSFATWLTEELESEDPNALRLEAFEWRDGAMRCRPLLRDGVAV